MDNTNLLKLLTMIFETILIYLIFSFIEANFNPTEWNFWSRTISVLWLFYAWKYTLKEK
jgi:hypothetical protein